MSTSKSYQLNTAMLTAMRSGHIGLFSTDDLAFILNESVTPNFRKLLSKLTRQGVLTRIARNIYSLSAMPPTHKGSLEKIAQLLHWNKFIYVSLESELSRLGIISQQQFGYLTVMTTGRSGKISTPFGTIEFTHTSKAIDRLKQDVWYETETGIFRATEKRALADLKRVGRNISMLNGGLESHD
jgi:predicted transcriptional regulator of viral defense system